MRNWTDVLRLIAAILICQAAGGIGSIATMSSIPTWYAALSKPSFSPPNWVFAPVWTILYTMMGVAAWLVWNKGIDNPAVRRALVMFVIQLVLNMAWTFIFFGAKMPFAGFVEIVLLWFAIVLTTIWFFRISIPAGVLMIPYILWVSFASVLNFSLWWLNRGIQF